MTDSLPKTVWPTLNCRDARAEIAFLVEAFGFVEAVVVPEGTDDLIAHAELLWPEGGGVMLGSADRDGNEFARLPTGVNSIYVVTDDPDGLYSRSPDAGAQLVRELRDEEYGSRGFTVRDPEGNLWSFGTYRGEPLPD